MGGHGEINRSVEATIDRLGAGPAALARGLLPPVVGVHLIHIFSKLGVDDRTAAVVAALERGIIRLPGRTR
jgi:hypothetical protein